MSCAFAMVSLPTGFAIVSLPLTGMEAPLCGARSFVGTTAMAETGLYAGYPTRW